MSEVSPILKSFGNTQTITGGSFTFPPQWHRIYFRIGWECLWWKMMKNNGVLNLHLPIVNLRSDGQEYPLWIHKPCCGRQQEYLSNKWGKRSIFGTFQILLFSPRRLRIPFSPSLPMLCLQNNSASVPWPCNGRLSWKYVLFSRNAMAQLLIVQMRGRSPRTQQHEYNYCTQMSVHVKIDDGHANAPVSIC